MERDVDQFNAEGLGDGKMAVITGHRAEEFHLVQLAPRRAPHYAVAVGTGYGIVHQGQAGGTVHDDIVRRSVHHLSHQFPGLFDPGQYAVVPDVAVCTRIIALAV